MKTLVAACAVALALLIEPPVAAAAKPAPRTLARAELPAGFAVGSASPSLALQVEIADGRVVASSPAGEGAGNLRATRGGDAAETMLTVSSDLAVAIKFDLYISADGERFTYTSTCGLTPGVASFEMWKQPIALFALGNPRVVPSGRVSCD